jgi:histidine triad (HIT) family protein
MGDATDCLFCRIIRGDFGTEFVAESDEAVAFRDIDPKAPTHVLVVPRRHVNNLAELGREDSNLLSELIALTNRVARQAGIETSGYRVLANVGPDAGQSVAHLHFHVLGGRKLVEGLG